MLIHKVAPKYPKKAKKQHLEGTVRLKILIDPKGNVIEVSAINGDSLLTSAAIEAVKKWRYKPVTLNGQAVEVETTVDVDFALN